VYTCVVFVELTSVYLLLFWVVCLCSENVFLVCVFFTVAPPCDSPVIAVHTQTKFMLQALGTSHFKEQCECQPLPWFSLAPVMYFKMKHAFTLTFFFNCLVWGGVGWSYCRNWPISIATCTPRTNSWSQHLLAYYWKSWCSNDTIDFYLGVLG